MATSISARIKIAYEDATSRNYTFNGVDPTYVLGIKYKIEAINQAIHDGTSDGTAFKSIFVSDDGAQAIGITEGIITQTEQEVIYSAS